MKRRLQPADALPQEPVGTADGGDQIGDALSPYLTSLEAARYLRFTTRDAFHQWTIRNRVPVCRRGRTLLFERRVLDAFVKGQAWTRRHSA